MSALRGRDHSRAAPANKIPLICFCSLGQIHCRLVQLKHFRETFSSNITQIRSGVACVMGK